MKAVTQICDYSKLKKTKTKNEIWVKFANSQTAQFTKSSGTDNSHEDWCMHWICKSVLKYKWVLLDTFTIEVK